MHSVFRIMLLAVCLAMGIAVAVAVALKKPAEATVPAAAKIVSKDVVAAERAAPSDAPIPAPSPPAIAPPLLAGSPIFEPVLAPYSDLVAQQQQPPAEPAAEIPASDEPAAQPPPAEQPAAELPAETPSQAPTAVAEQLPVGENRDEIRDEGDGRLVINLQNTDIRHVLEQVSNDYGLNIMASKSVSGTVTANLTGVDIDTALAAILKSTGFISRREGNILYVGTPADFAAMDQTQDRLATRVYRPNYITAADFQTLITPLLSAEIGKSMISSPAEVDIPADQVKTGGNSFASTDVVMVHDYEAVLREIDEIFIEVDVRPKQVAIEAMILSVKLTDVYKLGVNFEALRGNDNVRLISGSPLANLAAIDVSAGGLKFGFMDQNLSVFIDALETIGDTNVIAAPRLTCLNKQRAEIQIGEELGYVSTTVTETSATQTVNFLDVGTLLRIRPFISSDGQIRLEVHPELSTGTVTVDQGLSLPSKTVTQVTTNVMCPDGCTVIIGGLIREDLKTNTRQIPLLGNLPWLGPAFRQKTETTERNEIIVVITPRIVSEPMMTEEGVKYGNEFTQRQSVYFDKMSPIAKRNYGLHHLRMARAAYAAGDYNAAMKQVNLAIHYDPLNRDAIVLRNEVVAAGGFEDESIHEYLNRGLAPLTGRHRDYSKRGYPWKEFEGFGPPEMSSVDDPGQPGNTSTILQQQPPFPLPPPVEYTEPLEPVGPAAPSAPFEPDETTPSNLAPIVPPPQR